MIGFIRPCSRPAWHVKCPEKTWLCYGAIQIKWIEQIDLMFICRHLWAKRRGFPRPAAESAAGFLGHGVMAHEIMRNVLLWRDGRAKCLGVFFCMIINHRWTQLLFPAPEINSCSNRLPAFHRNTPGTASHLPYRTHTHSVTPFHGPFNGCFFFCPKTVVDKALCQRPVG